MPLLLDRRQKIIIGLSALTLAALIYFFYNLRPPLKTAEASNQKYVFIVSSGDGFLEIADQLEGQNFIRSSLAFKILAILKGETSQLKPGIYEINPSLSGSRILSTLVHGAHREIAVTIPEGSSIFEIDKILSDQGIIAARELINIGEKENLEGRLFPDTYNFFTASNVEGVIKKFLENFDNKAAPILGKDPDNFESNLIVASLLEKEVPDFEERKIVAGIIKKRLKDKMPLQIDATICYIKRQLSRENGGGCYPLSPLDFKIDSPYNTYLHLGLPPAPIGNPGISAIKAAMEPKNSPYWYYLSDPVTKKTIFAQTLDEHNHNRFKYLK